MTPDTDIKSYKSNKSTLDILSLSLGELKEKNLFSLTDKQLLSLNTKGIETLLDLLLLFPSQYHDKRNITPICKAQIGVKVLLELDIVQKKYLIYKKQLHLKLKDSLSSNDKINSEQINSTQMSSDGIPNYINIILFNIMPYIQNKLNIGTTIRCYGEINQNRQMLHPKWNIVNKNKPFEASIEIVYPKMPPPITNASIQNIIKKALELLEKHPPRNYLYDFKIDSNSKYDETNQLNEMSLEQTFKNIHTPHNSEAIDLLHDKNQLYIKRLAYEELCANSLAFKWIREHQKVKNNFLCEISKKKNSIIDKFLDNLHFELTQNQKKIWREIINDMTNPDITMSRLIQGDVGSGKTVLAALGAILSLVNDFQVALVAPTTILAQQHYDNIKSWFDILNDDFPILLLTSNTKVKEKKKIQQILDKKEPALIIATHSIFEESTNVPKLALAIFDEQQRFGVAQRLALIEKNTPKIPHQLMMSATPIPRSLMMVLYDDLDVSILNEMPKGKKLVNTSLISENKRDKLMQHVDKFCKDTSQQVYWVCSLIEPLDSDLQVDTFFQTKPIDALHIFNLWQKSYPERRVGFIHGKMKNKEKEMLMTSFNNKEIDVLVSTTVVEVGISIDNANIMVIENPERLGLSQLHQLRGRVGRGHDQGFCVLVYSQNLNKSAIERLNNFKKTSSGFDIAELDLKYRGGGHIFSTEQSGVKHFKTVNMVDHYSLLPAVQKIIPHLYSDENIKKILVYRWFGHKINLSRA